MVFTFQKLILGKNKKCISFKFFKVKLFFRRVKELFQYKGCFGSLNEVEQLSLEMSIIFLVKIWIQSARTPLLMGLRQKWMIPSCCLWKVVTFFGKEHVNWFHISGVMIGRSWTIKSIIFLVNCSKHDFLTSSFYNSTKTGPFDMFFTKKCNYFSWRTRWNHPFWSQSL